MKKMFYLLLVLPLLGLTACSDDDDIPNVDVTVSIEGATRVGDVLYVVEGETLSVTSINLVDNTAKGAVIGSASYFWDYYRFYATINRPYGMSLSTVDMPLGNHLLEAIITIYAVDYAPCQGYINYKVRIVPSADDIPTDSVAEENPTVKAMVRIIDDNDD